MKKYTILFIDGTSLLCTINEDKNIYEVMKRCEEIQNQKFPAIQYIFDFDAQLESQWNTLAKKWVVSIEIYKKNLHK